MELQCITVTGMAFTLYNGQAWWDRAGKRSASWLPTKYYRFGAQTIAMRNENGLTYLHSDHPYEGMPGQYRLCHPSAALRNH